MSNSDTGGTQQLSRHRAAAPGQLPPRSQSTARADKSHLATAKATKARQTPESSSDDKSTTGAKPINPCKLVSLSEAQTITGGAITNLIEAPLGPTCIYSGNDGSAGITLAVENESFSKATGHMRASKHVVIGGHRSLCGRLGTQMLFVPLNQYRLLNVTASCGIAQRFAVLAVGRLSA